LAKGNTKSELKVAGVSVANVKHKASQYWKRVPFSGKACSMVPKKEGSIGLFS